LAGDFKAAKRRQRELKRFNRDISVISSNAGMGKLGKGLPEGDSRGGQFLGDFFGEERLLWAMVLLEI
jgi:hypothetical protein